MAGNQTESINEKHHELYISPSHETRIETQTLPLNLLHVVPRYCYAKTSKEAMRNEEKHFKDVFLFSYINQGIMARNRGFHRIHSLAACNLRGQRQTEQEDNLSGIS